MKNKTVSNEDLLKEIKDLKKEVEELKTKTSQLVLFPYFYPIPHVCQPCSCPNRYYPIQPNIVWSQNTGLSDSNILGSLM